MKAAGYNYPDTNAAQGAAAQHAAGERVLDPLDHGQPGGGEFAQHTSGDVGAHAQDFADRVDAQRGAWGLVSVADGGLERLAFDGSVLGQHGDGGVVYRGGDRDILGHSHEAIYFW